MKKHEARGRTKSQIPATLAGPDMRLILRSHRNLVKKVRLSSSLFIQPAASLVRIFSPTHYADRMAVPLAAPRIPRAPVRFWIDAQAWAIRRLHSMHRTRSAPHLEVGALGEREALFYLRRAGYVIVARRWKTAQFRGDLDLIAWQGATLCFIEIKTRSQRSAFSAELSVDEDKQRILRRLARIYLRRIPPSTRPSTARFDVVSLYLGSDTEQKHPAKPEFILNQGAFGWE